MKKIGINPHIFSILCVILWHNSSNTRFGHFLVENQNTGRKNSFCNSAGTLGLCENMCKVKKEEILFREVIWLHRRMLGLERDYCTLSA